MQKRIILILFLAFVFSHINAQEKFNYKAVDVKSYDLYLKKNWTELIEFSSAARKQGIDFYLLQMRTGIAYYKLGKYRMASHCFLKNWENDQSSDLLQEYLYYSLVYSGRIYEARKISEQFNDGIKNKLKIENKGLKRMAYEGGYVVNSDFDDLKDRSFSTETNLGSSYGEASLLNDYSFHTFDLNHQISPNFTLNHSFTYIKVNREAIVDWDEKLTNSISTKQFQYFINPVMVIGKKLKISPSLNLISGNVQSYIGRYNNSNNKEFNLSTKNYFDYVFSTSLWSDFRNFSPGIELNAGEIYKVKFTQTSVWCTYYPLSNTSLYITPKVYFKSDSYSQGFAWNAFGLSAGGKIGKAYLSGQYLFGEMKNFVEAGGYLVSNFPGKSDQKIMGSLYYPIGKKLQLVLRYINQNVTEKYNIYTDGDWSGSSNYDFTKHSITGGISWVL